jgi:hypothetical protein
MGSLSLGAREWVHEAVCLPPSRAKVKNEWHYTFPVPHMPFWCAQGQLYLYHYCSRTSWMLDRCGFVALFVKCYCIFFLLTSMALHPISWQWPSMFSPSSHFSVLTLHINFLEVWKASVLLGRVVYPVPKPPTLRTRILYWGGGGGN